MMHGTTNIKLKWNICSFIIFARLKASVTPKRGGVQEIGSQVTLTFNNEGSRDVVAFYYEISPLFVYRYQYRIEW